ncbi:hypothetical protein EV1_003680 [Malus domestica]
MKFFRIKPLHLFLAPVPSPFPFFSSPHFPLLLNSSLARFNALVHATCFPNVSSSSNTALAYLKLIQHLAVYKGYTEAFAALKIAAEKFLSISKSRILLLKLQLLHERALHRGHLKFAQQVRDKLGVLASSVNGVDMELKTEASLRKARIACSKSVQ